MRWRRYTGPAGVVNTFEIPEQVLRGCTTIDKVVERMKRWQRVQERKRGTALLVQRIQEGVKPQAIAHELGRHVNNVYKWKRKMK